MNILISRKKAVYLILIALLALILLVQQITGRTAAPEIPVLKADITEITIENSGETISLIKSGDTWLLGEQKFPGDSEKIENLARKLKELKALEQVSASGFFRPYQLEDQEAIQVTLSESGSPVRTVLIGRASPTGRQSYLRFAGANEVLLVSGNLRRDFELSVDDLRQKMLFSLDSATVRRIEFADADTSPEGIILSENGWTTDAGEALDQEKVKNFLRNFESFSVSSFPDESVDSGELIKQIRFEADSGDITVELLQENEQGYTARSSASPYIFQLAKYKGQQLNKSVSDFAPEDQ